MSGEWLLCGMLGLPSASPAPAYAQAALSADAAYWYVDVYKPFFAETIAEEGGGRLMVAQRPRARESSFPRPKLPRTARVFVLGGSVGFQYDSDARQSHGWTLQRILEGAFPGKRYEIIHCGMGGYDSYREGLILEEILGYEPDIIVLMSGNNEVTAVSGPPTWLARRWPSLLPLQRRLHRLLIKNSPSDGGLAQAALQVERFERNVRAMVRLAKERGVPLVLCTMPRQLGLPPPSPLPKSETFLEAWTLAQEGRSAEAEQKFRLYSLEQPGDPFGPFWVGRLLEKRGDRDRARDEYERALRQDYARVHEINARIRRIAVEEGAVLADVASVLKNTAAGPRNDALVYDAMHWNRFADPLVSLAIAQALGDASPPGLRELFSRTALPALWSRARRLKPTDREREAIFRRKAMGAVWESLLGGGLFVERSVSVLEDLARDQPREFKGLASRKEDFSEHLGVWTESQRQDWDARWAFGLAHAGEACRRLGRHKEALAYFDAARSAGCSLPIVETHRALAQRGLDGKGRSVRQLLLEAYGDR